MSCNDALITGTTTFSAESFRASFAHLLAEKGIIEKAEKSALIEAEAHDCGAECTKSYSPNPQIEILDTRGFPSPQNRGLYRIEIDAKYSLKVRCRPVEEEPEEELPDSGGTGGGVQQPVTPPPVTPPPPPPIDCGEPSPKVSYSAGDLVDAKTFTRPHIQTTADQIPGLPPYHANGGTAALAAILTTVTCPKGCVAAWSDTPEIKTVSEDRGTSIIIRHFIQNDIKAICQ